MFLKNLCPHDIVVFFRQKTKIIKSEGLARVVVSETPNGTIQVDGSPIPLVRVEFGEIEGLPDAEQGTVFIVSSIVKEAAKERNDLVAPDTGKSCIRNAAGQILGITRFLN